MGFTLDFPSRTPDPERQRLSYANAAWALAQPRDFQLYASVQPGADLDAYLALKPDGIALGGLAPFSSDRKKLTQAVRAARERMPPGMPLHVFGIGHPDSIRACLDAGTTSTDSSSPQQAAAAGKHGKGNWTDASVPERLAIALRALDSAWKATQPDEPELPTSLPDVRPQWRSVVQAGLHEKGSALLTHPTGSGKTFFARLAARNALEKGQKVLMLVPVKALAAEVTRQWQEAFPQSAIGCYTTDQSVTLPYAQADIIVTTPERLELLLRRWETQLPWLARVGLCITDEVHLLGEEGRGARLDSALTRLKLIQPLTRHLLLSATVGDPQTLTRWIGGEHHHDPYRPVPLTWHQHPVGSLKDKEGTLVELCSPGTLVFVQSRKRAETLAATLEKAGFRAAYHHAGLKAQDRQEREQAFRDGQSEVLVCTPTLAMGVNTPCSQAILYDLSVARNGKFVALPTVQVWQRAGRAGRQEQADAPVHLLGFASELRANYPAGNFAPLRSTMTDPASTQDFILGSVDAGWGRTEGQLDRLLSRTFAAFASRKHHPSAQLVRQLVHAGGLRELGDGQLEVTEAGRVASQHLLTVQAVRRVEELPEQASALDVALIAALSLSRDELVALPAWKVSPSRVLQQTAQATVTVRPSTLLDDCAAFYLHQVYVAELLLSACETSDADVAATEDLYETEITAIREAALRLVTAWAEYRPEHTALKFVRCMLDYQVSYEQASLTLIHGIGGVTARTLARSGIGDVEALAVSLPEDLAPAGIGHERARQFIEQASDLVDTFTEDVTRQPGQPAVTRQRGAVRPLGFWPGHVDPRRLRRAAQLQVTPLEAGRYQVSGGQEAHTVTPEGCDCLDAQQGRLCKHQLAAQLWAGNQDLWAWLRELEGPDLSLTLAKQPPLSLASTP